MPAERSCGAVVFKRNGTNKYLLLHYEAGHWDFVKGHIERSESEKDTVAREIEEEAGLTDISFADPFRERISYFYRRAGRTVFKEVIFYLVEAKSGEVKISGEHIGYEWLDFPSAYDRLTYKNAKDILRKAEAFLERVNVKPLERTR